MSFIDIAAGIAEPIVYFAFFMFIVRFVFLEKGIKGNVGRIYLLVSILAFIGLNLTEFQSVAIFLMLFLVSIYICIGHKGNVIKKLLAMLQVFPIMGLVTGLTTIPITLAAMNSTDAQSSNMANLIFFTCFFVVFVIVFAIFRKPILELVTDSENRALQFWERGLLCFVGVVILFADGYEQIFPEYFVDVGGNQDVMDMGVFMIALMNFILSLVMIIIVIVGNKQNYYHNKVSRMQFNIIVTMAEIVENRDKNTGGHIKRTATYVDILAHQLRKSGKYTKILTDEYISDMRVAAPLHDIGKIHVSDNILNKEGPLDDDEFAKMRTHAQEGRILLSQAQANLGEFSYLNVALDMAGAHHEWWDGSAKGYPKGIKGEQIPLCARIMAVADVFDALTAKRVYKPAMPIEKAYSIIESESGTHFDPVIVEAFVACRPEIEAALNQYRAENGEA